MLTFKEIRQHSVHWLQWDIQGSGFLEFCGGQNFFGLSLYFRGIPWNYVNRRFPLNYVNETLLNSRKKNYTEFRKKYWYYIGIFQKKLQHKLCFLLFFRYFWFYGSCTVSGVHVLMELDMIMGVDLGFLHAISNCGTAQNLRFIYLFILFQAWTRMPVFLCMYAYFIQGLLSIFCKTSLIHKHILFNISTI
jgi:hypothetical protein